MNPAAPALGLLRAGKLSTPAGLLGENLPPNQKETIGIPLTIRRNPLTAFKEAPIMFKVIQYMGRRSL